MSNWLGNVSDSEGESTDVESNSDTRTESSEENEGFLRWMKPDDETGGVADENEGKRIMSNYEKAVNVVDDLCTTIRFVDWEDARSLQEAIEKFAEAAQATDNVLKKYGKFPYAFAELLTELGEEIERQKEDAEAGSDDDEEGEENKASKSARKFADLFAKRVEEKRAQYKDHIERVLAGEEDDEEGEESDADADEDGAKLTPEAIEAFLIAGTTSKADIKTCRRVISTSRQGGMKNYEISATAHLCACLLENAPSTGPSSAQWRHAHRALNHSLALAEEHKTSISEATSGKFTPSLAIVKNGWASHAVSLWAAQVKAAQNSEYVPTALRVKDEALCASILDRCLNYYTQIGQKRGLGRCAAALLEILYVRTQEAHEVLNTQAPTFYMLKEKVSVAVAKLARIVEECNPDTDARLMAKMALIFSVALHDRFHEARDLFLNANIALDPIEADDTLLVRYNRVVAQIGLCAFRTGLFNEAHTILGDLCAKNQRDLRELLGQVDLLRAQRHYHDEDVEKTARDRYRFVPPHHALPVNVIEHGHLVLAMANDVIVEAKNPDERPQRSKQFFSLCKRHQSALFRGEPKEDAEFIYAAYEALLEGAMHRAIDYVKRISSWDFLPKGSRAIELLEQKLRQDGLKVFLISRGQHYASLTVDELVARFGLSAEEVKAIVSRLLLDHTLIGHWDHNDTHVVIERGPQSRLHLLSRDCADRIAHFASFNENPAAGPSGRDGRGGRGGFAGGRGRGRGRGSH